MVPKPPDERPTPQRTKSPSEKDLSRPKKKAAEADTTTSPSKANTALRAELQATAENLAALTKQHEKVVAAKEAAEKDYAKLKKKLAEAQTAGRELNTELMDKRTELGELMHKCHDLSDAKAAAEERARTALEVRHGCS